MVSIRVVVRRAVLMRLIRRAFACLIWFAAPVCARAAAMDCRGAGAIETARLGRVDARLDIVFADGRVIYFPSIEPPRATPAEPGLPQEVARQLTSLLRDGTLRMQVLGAADRWGRVPARLFIADSRESTDETLVAAGLAMVSADPGACAEGPKAAEAEARAAKLGIWADPAFAVLSGDDAAAFVSRGGTLAIVEGRIRSIGHGFSRTYLNFAGRRGAALVISKRSRRAFERAGFDEKSLKGRRVRARGVVEIGASPQIQLFHPGQIEFMEEASQAGAPKKEDSP
ncbi:thermonuclease family protein [Rhodoblastus acidophilus]|nr:thermonuclease family protein [Rhodoblastus acidophilus]